MSIEDIGLEKSPLSHYVKISILLHSLLVLAFSINILFFSDPSIDFTKAIRVDMVGLPDKITLPQSPEPATPALPKREEPLPVTTPPKLAEKNPSPKVDPNAVKLEKAKEKQALQKLKQMAALEEIQKSLDNDKRKKAAQAANRYQYKGNILNSGSELTGVNKMQAEDYIEKVHTHMMDQWILPEYLKNRNFMTVVQIRFDENGNILSKEVVKSSGNPSFDAVVLSTIQKSSPVPPPPAKFVRISSLEGFLFRFSHDD